MSQRLNREEGSSPDPFPAHPLRPPEMVMQLARLGASHQTRLSFVRTLIRRLMRERWQIERSRFDLDESGLGTCIYTVMTPGNERYSMVIFSQFLSDAERTDRVIAEKWDVAAALCEGVLSEARVNELRQEIPKQEAGRCGSDVLVLSRANKSTRNFAHVVDCLAQGRQPDPDVLARVGYLLRTTAVYGNGKFGVADYVKVRRRQAFNTTFAAQMFAVYLIRHFSLEWVEHLARASGGATAVPLHEDIKRYLGVGNATGLGMAPFLIKHPRLIHAWIAARETALARVLATEPTAATLEKLRTLTFKANRHFNEIETAHPYQSEQNAQVRATLPQLIRLLDEAVPATMPWTTLMQWASENGCLETQELVVSLLLELYPERVDGLALEMEADERLSLQPHMTLGVLQTLLEERYAWALTVNFSDPDEVGLFWYRSQEKEEPRLGRRFEEPGADKEMHIDIGRAVQRLHMALKVADPQQHTIHFLLQHPAQTGIVRRVQALADYPYAEVQANLLNKACLPIHLLRFKLATFGAGKFDPRSNLWLRITLFQGAPLVEEIGRPFADDWCFPVKPRLR